jgi:hypothetical protein
MSSAEQLSRTTLLFQTDLGIADPALVHRALIAPSILLVADAESINSFAGQVAISTAAMLMVRSGHSVAIDTPDAPLIGYQPPMEGRTFHEAIESVSDKLIDGVSIAIGRPLLPPEITFVFGGANLARDVRARRLVSVGWTDWSAELLQWPMQTHRTNSDWPIGAMGAAVLVAAEAAKIVGRSLALSSGSAPHFRELFAPCEIARLVLAPEATPRMTQLGSFDIISAGAVSNAFLYTLFRLPNATGNARTFDRDTSDHSNRNRNMLLLPDFVGQSKVGLFQHFSLGIVIDPVPRHFSEADLSDLADRVAVGVDDIPTRWTLAGARTSWMGVGATSHFESMASVHYPYSACAACLHPQDEVQIGPTPTIAFSSFLAGLMLAADFLRDVAGAEASLASRYRYLTALQTANPWSSSVVPNSNCPAHCSASLLRAA